MKIAIVLLSGGLDSATVIAVAEAEGYAVHALSFDYGQRHSVELDAAKAIAARHQVAEHRIIRLDPRALGGSALTDAIDVPKHRSDAELGSGIPVTYVPARNTLFLSYALAWAEVLETGDIFIGVNALDYSGYPDCRPAFISAFEAMANLATRGGVEGSYPIRIHAPLQDLTKAQIIEFGMRLDVDYSLTISCYDPRHDGKPCGACDACLLRAKGFATVGRPDPRACPLCGLIMGRSRSYAVKEIFYTLQGEGAQAGRPAVFCRFTGCNLWSGREQHRERAVCRFCDTEFVGMDGVLGARYGDARALASQIDALWPPGEAHRFVVLTGGEPLLQVDASLIDALHDRGFEVAVETNGTLPLPAPIDWVCVSPKAGTELKLVQGSELKLVYPQDGAEPTRYEALAFEHFYLQPMDGPALDANTVATLAYCRAHPQWRFSLQTHKVLAIP